MDENISFVFDSFLSFFKKIVSKNIFYIRNIMLCYDFYHIEAVKSTYKYQYYHLPGITNKVDVTDGTLIIK